MRNTAYNHLKWKLINNQGLSPQEAQERVKEMIRVTKENHKLAKLKEKAENSKPVKAKDIYDQLIKRNKDLK